MKLAHGLVGLIAAFTLSFTGSAWSSGAADRVAPYPPPSATESAPTYDPAPVEARLAYLKNELKITAEQSAAWDRYADAYRSTSKSLSSIPAPMMRGDLPSRMAAQESMMAAELEAMRTVSGPLTALYAVLTADQKRTADELMSPER